MFRRYFGHATPQLTSLQGLRELMQDRAFNIIGTVPEGTSCNFVYDEPVGAFTKVGLIKVALETGADIVLAGQSGVEVFGLPLRLPGRLRLPLAEGPRGIQLPIYLPWRKARVTVRYRRYEPLMLPAQRAALDPAAARRQLGREFRTIRQQLIELCR